MQKNIEVEMRGSLTDSKFLVIKQKLDKLGSFVQNKKRVLIDYSTLLPEEGVRDRTRDIRIRNTNGSSEIIVKVGGWGGSEQRQELSVPTTASFDDLAQTMRFLGYERGMLCVRNTLVYEYKEVEFALVEVPGHSYYFEAEIVVTDDSRVESARDKITEILSEFELETFSDEAFYQYIETLNKEANEVFDATAANSDFFESHYQI